MRVGNVLTATDENPLYWKFIPNFIKAWKAVLPEANIHVVFVGKTVPEELEAYARYIRRVDPIEGIHTAFHAQCVRLLFPRHVGGGPTLITDMDMLPMNRSYYTEAIKDIPDDHFTTYRDVCLPGEIAMCYNIATSAVWTAMFGDSDMETTLKRWYSTVRYTGEHGGSGWNTDQIILLNAFNAWPGPKITLNDSITGYNRLDRIHPWVFEDKGRLEMAIRRGVYSDYHCLRPYDDHKEMNDFVVSCLLPKKVYSFLKSM
jgi:hypothetical protein